MGKHKTILLCSDQIQPLTNKELWGAKLAKMPKQEAPQEGKNWPPSPLNRAKSTGAQKVTQFTMGSWWGDALIGWLMGTLINFFANITFLLAGNLFAFVARKMLLPYAKAGLANPGPEPPLFLWSILFLSLLACFLIPVIRRPYNLILTVAFALGVATMACLNAAFWLWTDTIALA